MAKSMRRHKTLTVHAVTEFYTSRIRRIVPIYWVVMMCVMISGKILIHEPQRLPSKDAMAAILFVSNMNAYLKEKNYFTLVGHY